MPLTAYTAVMLSGSAWHDVVHWTGWSWPGWIAVSAVGTVGALLFLAYQGGQLRRQVRELKRQNDTAENNRGADQRQRREEYQRTHTPFLTLEGAQAIDEGDSLVVQLHIRPHGSDPAFDVQLRGSIQSATGDVSTTASSDYLFISEVIRLEFKRSEISNPPWQISMHLSYKNMFEQLVKITQQGRIAGVRSQLVMISGPVYEWPWSINR